MTADELNNLYFDWMCQLVYDEKHAKQLPYRKLLTRLHDTAFSYIIAMDANREEDGIDLRYRFGYENSYANSMIATYLDNCPCSILEMLIALAIRCEEHIMEDPDIGDRTGKWFWIMIDNLGLSSMSDAAFDKKYVDYVVSKFLNREYERDGKGGGLFTVEHSNYDMRSVEIWYQMCWYLSNVIRKE